MLALTLCACNTVDNTALLQTGIAILNEINTPQSQAGSSAPPKNSPNNTTTKTPQSTAPQSQETRFEIVNQGNPHAGAAFGFSNPKHLTYVQTTVRVNEVPQQGLNFFALQVNFTNGTWAHGGLQYNYGKDWVANWGGLVFRGGGAADYQKAHQDDLIKIQNPKRTTHPYAWQTGKTYELIVWRGEQIHLDEGTYDSMGKSVYVDKARTMWEWHFNITPINGGEEFNATLYNSAATIKDFMVWSECGYGSCGQIQRSNWSMPIYSNNAWDDSFEVSKYFQRF